MSVEEELGVFTAERYFNDDALAGEGASLWCDRSSSSFSSAFKTCQHDESAPTPTASTSSSEASWNSRSVLLPNRPAPSAAAAPAIEGKPDSTAESEPTGGKALPPSSHSHLRRWILGMAGCACVRSDIEAESVSADDDLYREEMEAAGSFDGGKERSSETDATLPTRGTSKQSAVEGNATVRVMSGKWVGDGGALPYTIVAGSKGRPPVVSATQSSAYTIVAGSTAPARGGVAGGGSRMSPNRAHRRLDSESDVPSEAEYMYPPSEASIVWSVVTAEGAASGNFSCAASGRHYYFDGGDEEEAMRHMAAGGKSNRRGRNSSGGGLLTGCMSKRAVDTVGRPRTWSDLEVRPAPVARVRGPDMGRRRR